MATGGVSCAMKDCSFTSRNSKKSFFRFPKNPERSQLWVQACDNTNLLKMDTMQLYRSFRVCGSHFTPIMFLNDLKNRLHSHAVPEEIAEEIEFVSVSNSFESTLEPKFEILHNCDSEENVKRTNLLVNSRLQVEKSDKNKSIKLCEKSDLSENSPNILGKDLPEQRTIATKKEDISTPTSPPCSTDTSMLCSYSPRKTKLRHKINILRSGIQRSKSETEQHSEFNIENVTLDQYMLLTDKFLPKPIAEFVKMHVGLANKKPKDRRNTNARLHRLKFKQS